MAWSSRQGREPPSGSNISQAGRRREGQLKDGAVNYEENVPLQPSTSIQFSVLYLPGPKYFIWIVTLPYDFLFKLKGFCIFHANVYIQQ
jgi:hypothetical protein